ncbi:hypothetical protein ACOZ4I_04250 [Haloarcula salina]|uniref:hypothetical protein n=1 Tax=Haloarcula salina TaxID=1429914 RepID=UPI003C6F8BD4
MLRRSVLAAFCTAGLSGCLRLTGDTSPPAEQTTESRTRPGNDGSPARTEAGATATSGEADGGGLFASRSEAIEFARSFAASGVSNPVSTNGSGDPELIRHGGGWGSSYGSGPQGGIYTSSDIKFEAISDDGVAFGGDSGRSIRIRNLTLGSEITFEPTSDSPVYRVNDWDIDPETEGVPPTEIGLDVGADSEHVFISGTWTGDRDIFNTQTFCAYEVDLLEGGTRIGGTTPKVYGIQYNWGAKQTPDELYITRQPSVDEEWTAELFVGENTFEAKARQTCEHVVEDDVFRADLSAIDLDPGQYGWSVLVGTKQPIQRNKVIQLTPLNTGLILQ